VETLEYKALRACVVKSDLLDIQETQVHLVILDSLDQEVTRACKEQLDKPE
jgi:hypothetical protein